MIFPSVATSFIFNSEFSTTFISARVILFAIIVPAKDNSPISTSVPVMFPFNVVFPKVISVPVTVPSIVFSARVIFFATTFPVIVVFSQFKSLALTVPLIEVSPNVTSFADNVPVIKVLPAVCVKLTGLSVVPKLVVEFSSLPKKTVSVVLKIVSVAKLAFLLKIYVPDSALSVKVPTLTFDSNFVSLAVAISKLVISTSFLNKFLVPFCIFKSVKIILFSNTVSGDFSVSNNPTVITFVNVIFPPSLSTTI